MQITGTIVAPDKQSAWNSGEINLWIRFYGISGLTIEGGGVIDGQGQDWWSKSCKVNQQQVRVPFNSSVSPHRCVHVATKKWVVLLNHTKGLSHLPNTRQSFAQ